jgi:MOSC domain-containing protein YiiM
VEGRVRQINISPKGGLPKLPVLQGYARKLGLEGDAVAHPQFHGGPRQALLLICEEALDELKQAGWPVYPGALGENITMSGIDRKLVRLGDQFRIGGAAVAVTKIRVPCATLNVYGPGIQKDMYDAQVKAGDFNSPRWGVSGFYVSVEEEGVIVSGDPIIRCGES